MGTQFDPEALEARLAALSPAEREELLRVADGAAAKIEQQNHCGCHQPCIIYPHRCDRPCVWPHCLTRAERAELASEPTWPRPYPGGPRHEQI